MNSKFWNNVYETKNENGVSWYQETPKLSLETILSLKLPYSANLIDVGGGRSKLAENLYLSGFKNITVLDISDIALEKMKHAIDEKFPGNKVETMATDIVEAKFDKQFDVWHDRAVFHFLTNQDDQQRYVDLLLKSLTPDGYFLIFTFSKNGPLKCSGLEICQYDKEDLVKKFAPLQLVASGIDDHPTPFNTIQNFTWCLFKK